MTKPGITIVGLGLIGGSIGLALRQEKRDYEVVGHDRDPERAKRAHKAGAVDRTEWNLVSACEEAELIVIATPVIAVKEVFTAVAPYLKPNCVLTDTASTKQQVMAWAEEILPRHVSFVGGDPMVGQMESGLESASADLFANAVYCLTPSPRAEAEAVALVADLVHLLGAKPYFLDAAEHDGLVAGIGHLPFLLSTALLNAASQSTSWRELKKLASFDFRRATHFASEDPATFRDICLTNRDSILRWLDACLASLNQVRQTVAAGDAEKLDVLFQATLDARQQWLRGKEPGGPAEEALAQVGRSRLRSFLFGSR